MLLVLFTMVLLLPAFQVEGGRYRRDKGDPTCYRLLVGAANIHCILKGHKGFRPNREPSCQFRCDADSRYDLPDGVCKNGHLPCNDQVRAKLREWKEEMEEKKRELIPE